ncbi:MAG TPA: ABC transporter ATP-binding protein [Rubrivivax sp.]|nr:ABC transporter ATP-binding protein [Rubrivivax sp.]
MSEGCTRPVQALVLTCLVVGSVAARAATPADEAGHFEPGHWRLAVSPYSLHFSPSEEHEMVYAVALERQRDDGWLWGGSYFSNSFGQPSAYLYVGQRLEGISWAPQFFAQWTGGLMYGYRGKYEDKVPLNNNGFSPGLLLSVGWAFDKHFSTQMNLLGSAGLMWQLSYDFR